MRFKVDVHFNLNDLKINKVIRSLVLADLFFWGGWGIVNPILAIFIVGKIPGATVLTVGMASAMYWIVKAIFQIPVAIYLDKLEGERGDFNALVFGLILAGFAAMIFPIISSMWGLFAAVFLQAIAYGLYTPSWSSLFSRHLDKDHYAFDWSLDSTTIGIVSGVAALIGGTIAELFGFNMVFILTGVLSFVSAGTLLFVPGLIMPRPTTPKQPLMPEHTPGEPKM